MIFGFRRIKLSFWERTGCLVFYAVVGALLGGVASAAPDAWGTSRGDLSNAGVPWYFYPMMGLGALIAAGMILTLTQQKARE